MKQQDAYKLLAAFMILIMIVVPVAYVITSPRSDITPETNEELPQEKYNPELWTINQPFDTITDALNMTPPSATSADFIDLEGMTPQMLEWARQDLSIISEVDTLYKSNTTKLYYTQIKDGKNESFLLLSTMFPYKNDFQYMVLPGTDNILRRQDTGAINILGSPIIYAPDDRIAVRVLEIIYSFNKTTTAYDQYGFLLSKVDKAPFQTLNSNVSFAKQYYMGIRSTNGSYERTTAYLDINASAQKKLNLLKANGTQKGFTQYNITKINNYTVIKIAGPDLFTLLMEETS